MRRQVLAFAAVVFVTACGIDDSSVTEPSLPSEVSSTVVVPGCPAGLTYSSVRTKLRAVYPYVHGDDDDDDDDSPRSIAEKKLDQIKSLLSQNKTASAKAKAWDLAKFTLQMRDEGKLVGSEADLIAFLNALFCYAGLGPYFTDADNTFLVLPGEAKDTLITHDGFAGIVVPANNVTEPTLVTITPLTNPPPLNTKLDVYPQFFDFVINQSGGTGWVNPVIVGVCPGGNVPDDVKPYLVLGHQGTTFELLPEADASFLDCSGAGGSGNVVMNVTGDSTLVAAAVIGSSGVGGSTDDFSPIAPVDGRVVGSAGAGGSADDFRPRRGMTPSMNLVSLPIVSCSPITASIGTEVDPACRPTITFATPTQHTPIEGVNVAWSVESGAGSIATPAGCSPFSSILSQATDANGITIVCWKLGNIPGTNMVTALASPGGEAPQGVTFVYSEGGTLDPAAIKIRFTATGIQLDPAVTATGASGLYNGSAYTGSGTCTPNSLTPVLSYDTGNGQAPVNTGTYTLTVTCGVAGDPNDIYTTQTAQGTITIGQASSTTTVNCPLSVSYNGSAQMPCGAATVTGAGGLNTTATVSYSNNTNAGTANASATYAGDVNHVTSGDSKTFAINKLNATATAGDATIQFGNPVPTIPCTVTGLLPIEPLAVTCTTSTPNTTAGTWPTVPVVSPTIPPNYNVTLGNGTLTVLSGGNLALGGPATLWTGLKNSDAVGLRIDLLAELLINGVVVASGTLPNQDAGSSGFNNAQLRSIAMSLAGGPANAPSGAQLRFRVSVRRTCFDTGHQSGIVRLWYDGRPIDTGAARDAGSRFPIVVSNTASEWFLRSASALSMTSGTAMKFVDVTVNSTAACPGRPYLPFGTWTGSMP